MGSAASPVGSATMGFGWMLVLAVACTETAPPASPEHAPASTSLREDARRVLLEGGCAGCHLSEHEMSPPPGTPRVVFDLREEDWSARMTEGQLRRLAWPEPHQDPSSSLSATELAVVRRFVEEEIARR